MIALAAIPVALPYIPPPVQSTSTLGTSTIPNVPFFSQLADITAPEWRQVGCGITSLAMIVNYYEPNAVSVDDLLEQGIAAGAFDKKKGWTYSGLIELAGGYGLDAQYRNLSKLGSVAALAEFRKLSKNGPLILSVSNRFNRKSKLPHMIVVEGIRNGTVYYNDPAAESGGKKISFTRLFQSWKGKIITFRPVDGDGAELGMLDFGARQQHGL